VTVDTRDDWRTQAACTEVDPEIMHPIWRSEDIAAAKRVCAGCEVRVECLQHALERGEDDGVWGGLTPSERRKHSSDQSDESERMRRSGDCPECGRVISLAHGALRHHNVSKDYGSLRCPGSGWIP
jgi:WhiB family redox-sensing transcriptional regulator